MDIKEAVKSMPVLQAANPASLATLIPCAIIKRFKKGRHLFLDGDEARQVYFLVEGAAALYKASNHHEKKVIFIYGPGALLNETILDGKPTSVNCELLSDAQILCFEWRRFLYACEQDFMLSKAVMDSMSLKIRRMYRQMKNTPNAVRGDRRIAAKLWKLSRDHGIPCPGGVMINFDLTITFLADLLGSKRETVSRQLKLLTGRNLVVINRNRFIIPNRDELKKYFYQV